jgi:NAD binding domain of 6-phosphogluconate dehydrogenase
MAIVFDDGVEPDHRENGGPVQAGLRVARSVEESVREADIVVVSVSDYSSTRQLLAQPEIEAALRGKIVVQLSSGTPKDAREMASWARRCGIAYLDGAILGSPEWIGTPACTIFYSGPAEVFERVKPVLMIFGERTVFVGHEIGHAALEAYSVVTKQLVCWCEDRGSDHTIPDAYVNLMQRAIEAGKSQAGFACLFEILSDVPAQP